MPVADGSTSTDPVATDGACRFTLTLVNKRGLHARAAARFVREADTFDADVRVVRDGQQVDGRSIMGLLMLCAPFGSTIEMTVTGPEAGAAADALTRLVASGFGEVD